MTSANEMFYETLRMQDDHLRHQLDAVSLMIKVHMERGEFEVEFKSSLAPICIRALKRLGYKVRKLQNGYLIQWK